MNRLSPLIALIVLATTPAPAAADDGGPRFGNPQPEVALGIGGVGAVGSIASGAGVHLEALVRLLPETLAGIEADALLVSPGDPALPAAPGRPLRAGAKLRQSIMGWGPLSLGGELAAVLGMGWEQIEWNGGGRLRRTQLVIGVEDGLVMHVRRGGRQRYAGVAFGARGVFSRANPDCNGPCMNGVSGWSGGVLFDLIVRASP